jgi:putative transposase
MAKSVNMRTLFHCVYALHYHLVIVTKYRRRCITRPMLEMLQDITAQRCQDWGGVQRRGGSRPHPGGAAAQP